MLSLGARSHFPAFAFTAARSLALGGLILAYWCVAIARVGIASFGGKGDEWK